MKKKEIIGKLPSGWLTEKSGERQKEKRYTMTEDFLEISTYSRSKEMALTGQD